MRLTVMGQFIKGLATELEAADRKSTKQAEEEEADERLDAVDVARRLETSEVAPVARQRSPRPDDLYLFKSFPR
jgi:hypothetical protein